MSDLPDDAAQILAAQTLAAQKASLRRAALARRDAFAADARRAQAAAQAVAARARSDFPLDAHRGVIAGYWPIRSELDPRPLMEALDARAVALALPVVTPGGLIFRRWRGGMPLVDTGFGTRGPGPDAPQVDPDVLLVPLAAFDRRGNRLGYGQGHYDAAIARLAGKGALTAIGLAFDIQEIGAVPAEPHDRPLDAIVTQVQSIIVDSR